MHTIKAEIKNGVKEVQVVFVMPNGTFVPVADIPGGDLAVAVDTVNLLNGGNHSVLKDLRQDLLGFIAELRAEFIKDQERRNGR